MTSFEKWCDDRITESVDGHHLVSLTAADANLGVALLAEVLPGEYEATQRLQELLKRRGKKKAAKWVELKLPTTKKGRSGDLGEILGAAYVAEFTDYEIGPSRLIWKDHNEQAMRGDDVLAARLVGTELLFLKGEAKSGKKTSKTVVSNARTGLDKFDGLPNPHTVSLLQSRLEGAGHTELAEAIADTLVDEAIREKDVTHLMFLFSGNNSAEFLRADLDNYGGAVTQTHVALTVQTHPDFVRDVYEKVIHDGRL